MRTRITLDWSQSKIFLVTVLVLYLGFLAFALVLKDDILSLTSVLEVRVLVVVLSQDRDQDTNPQGKTQHSML